MGLGPQCHVVGHMNDMLSQQLHKRYAFTTLDIDMLSLLNRNSNDNGTSGSENRLLVLTNEIEGRARAIMVVDI